MKHNIVYTSVGIRTSVVLPISLDCCFDCYDRCFEEFSSSIPFLFSFAFLYQALALGSGVHP